MLARNFMDAAALRIPEDYREALIKVLGMLERGELQRTDIKWDPELLVKSSNLLVPVTETRTGFNMAVWRSNTKCGTVCCIGGWADIDHKYPYGRPDTDELDELYHAHSIFADTRTLSSITVNEAAQALRNYLTTGEARWSEVLA